MLNFRTLLKEYNDGGYINSYGYDNNGNDKAKMTSGMTFPFGIGIKYKADNQVDLALDYTFHPSNTDNMDAYLPENLYNDRFSTVSLSVILYMGDYKNSIEWITPLEEDYYSEEELTTHNTEKQTNTREEKEKTESSKTQTKKEKEKTSIEKSIEETKGVVVPEVVLQNFKKKFNIVSDVRWDKDNDVFTAIFTSDKDKNKYSADFSEEGEWLRTGIFQNNKDIKPSIKQYLNTKYKDYTIKAVEYTTTKDNKKYYYVTIYNKKDKKPEPAITKLYFDSKGKIKKASDFVVEKTVTEQKNNETKTQVTDNTSKQTDANTNKTEEKTKTDITQNTTVKTENTIKTENNVSSSDTTYYIIAGAAKTQEDAASYVNKLKGQGFNSEIIGKTGSGNFVISYNSFDSRQDAEKELARIQSSINANASIYKKAKKKETTVNNTVNTNTSEKTTSKETENKSNTNTTQSSTRYYIIAGSSPSEQDAAKLVNDLKSKGFSKAKIVGKSPSGYFRVCYSFFSNKDEANTELQKIKTTVNANAWMMQQEE